jgi:hypothetical protein
MLPAKAVALGITFLPVYRIALYTKASSSRALFMGLREISYTNSF